MDGRGFGEAADDYGSATALVMELARIFSDPDFVTERSIRSCCGVRTCRFTRLCRPASLPERQGKTLVAEGNVWRNPSDARNFSTQQLTVPVDNFVLKFQKPR